MERLDRTEKRIAATELAIEQVEQVDRWAQVRVELARLPEHP